MTIRTNIGATSLGDNFVRGLSVRDELCGTTTRWALLWRLIGCGDLVTAEAKFLDDLASAIASPDPRVWPLKLMWIVGSYGGRLAPMASLGAMLEGATFGPWACEAAADTCVAIHGFHQRPEEFAVDLTAWVKRARDSGARIPGFGVVARDADERVARIIEAAQRHACAREPHFAAWLAACSLLEPMGLMPNIGSALAACLLDLGCDRVQVGYAAYEITAPQIVGTAYEASSIRAALLRSLQPVVYRGPHPRRSPRSESSR